jgi:hypothetical protein
MGVAVCLVVLDVYLSPMFSDPVIPLVFVVGECRGGSLFLKPGCCGETCRTSSNDEDVVDVHFLWS